MYTISFLFFIQLYTISKLKAKQNLLDDLLQSLVEINLLKQFDKGVVTGPRRSTLFIKSLPASETLNTTNQFTLDLLDQISLPWLLYRPSCTTLLMPSNASSLSDEVDQYLQNNIYQRYVFLSRKTFFFQKQINIIKQSEIFVGLVTDGIILDLIHHRSVHFYLTLLILFSFS